MHFDRSVKQQQKASFWDDLFAEESAVETMYGWQCSSSGVHPYMPHWHLTAKVQHGHAHVAPLLCIQSDVHSILMRDTRRKQCLRVTNDTGALHSVLHELVGGERNVRPIELLSSKLI